MTLCRLDDGDAIIIARGEWFLHHDRDAVLGGEPGQRLVAVHPGRDVHEARLGLVYEHGSVGEPRHAEGIACGFGLRRVDVTNANDVGACILQVAPGVQMILGVEAAANQPYPYTAAHRLT